MISSLFDISNPNIKLYCSYIKSVIDLTNDPIIFIVNTSLICKSLLISNIDTDIRVTGEVGGAKSTIVDLFKSNTINLHTNKNMFDQDVKFVFTKVIHTASIGCYIIKFIMRDKISTHGIDVYIAESIDARVRYIPSDAILCIKGAIDKLIDDNPNDDTDIE